MNRISNSFLSDCVGCRNCEKICPTNAISMINNSEGFLVPAIDLKRCIDCGRCVNVCQIYKTFEGKHRRDITYATRHLDNNVRNNSSSGGFFQAIAEQHLLNGGYVCGCILDNLKVRHIVSNRLIDVRSMADSKYVQSDLGDCYKTIKDLLDLGKSVLFSGTSCQVYALNCYLRETKTSIENLTTIDFFCHGVTSPLIWDDYLMYYERKKKRKVVDFKWRSKKYGWGKTARGASHLNSVYYKKNDVVRIDNSLLARKWRDIFFSNLILRDCCYNCKFCLVDKPADITMADFWRIEEVLKDFDDGHGVSLVILHDENKIGYIEKNRNLIYQRCNLTDAIVGQKNAYFPSTLPDNRQIFWDDYNNRGIDYVMKKYFLSCSRMLKDTIRWILFYLKLGHI